MLGRGGWAFHAAELSFADAMVDTDGRGLVLHAHPSSIQDWDRLTFRQELAHAQTSPCRLGATTTGGLTMTVRDGTRINFMRTYQMQSPLAFKKSSARASETKNSVLRRALREKTATIHERLRQHDGFHALQLGKIVPRGYRVPSKRLYGFFPSLRDCRTSRAGAERLASTRPGRFGPPQPSMAGNPPLRTRADS